MKVAVLISGNGTNLQAILDDAAELASSGRPLYAVSLVISNRPEAYGLKRAARAGVPHSVIRHQDFPRREDFEEEIAEKIEGARIDLIALAGFMRILSPSFVKGYKGRILNIHPSLLPAFPGTHAIREAWEKRVPKTGVTIHFVDEGVDTGPVIVQEEVPILPEESLEGLEGRVHAVEHRLYPRVIRQFAEGKIRLEGRKVMIYR